jgi:biopolymer transport protein ExbD
MEQRLIDPRAVRANIARQRVEKPDSVVVIHAHKQSSNSALVRVMDASRLAGVYGISIASEDS